MKILTPSQSKKHDSLKKILLLFFLFAASLVVVLDIAWSYHIFESGLGSSLAQAAIAYHIILLLGLVVLGVWLGHWIDRMIRQKRSIFHAAGKGSWAAAFMNLWGYALKNEEGTKSDIDPESNPALVEPFVLLDLPSRRGRKPTFPLERWLPIAVQWENRDPIRDAFTLAELISDHLGTNADGSPIVSEQTYYSTWRPRAIAEIRRRAKSKKSFAISESEIEDA